MSNVYNLQEINQNQSLDLVKFYIRSNQNLALFGQKGVGKSFISIDAIKECGYKINYINLSVVEKSDLSGYPNVFTNEEIITFKSPYYLPPLKDGEKPNSVILFDEVDKASPDTTAPLLEILQFKTINNKKINAVSCILTGNLLTERTYSNQISSAILDRCAKYILSFDLDQWIEWAKNNNLNDLIIGFLKSNNDLALGKLDDNISYASPSPRSWHLASNALNKLKELKITDIDTVSKIVSGFVGYEAGIKFKLWYECYKQFEPFVQAVIETGTMGIDFHSLKPTEKIVFVISACVYAKQKMLQTKTPKLQYLENLCNFIKNYHIEPEIQLLGFYNSFSFNMVSEYKLYSCKPFFKLFNDLSNLTQFKK